MMDIQDITHLYIIACGGIALGLLLWWNDPK
jgi:hypothetical protein